MIRLLDFYYSIIESLVSSLQSTFSNKRWCNREKGTGYRNKK